MTSISNFNHTILMFPPFLLTSTFRYLRISSLGNTEVGPSLLYSITYEYFHTFQRVGASSFSLFLRRRCLKNVCQLSDFHLRCRNELFIFSCKSNENKIFSWLQTPKNRKDFHLDRL